MHKTLYLGPETVPYTVETVRLRQSVALIKLAGCDDRNSAEPMRGWLVQIPISAAVPLAQDEYYDFQLIGIQVYTNDGEYLGRLQQVLETGANDVYVVQGPRGQVLLPAIDQVVQQLDPDAGKMVVIIPPGLLDDNS